MSYRTLKSKLFGTIGGLAVAGMVLAGVATITAFTASSPQVATLDGITPPPLPDGMAPVPAGNELFLGTHAVGTQNYVCQPSGAGVAYVLFTPQATLFGEDGVQIITHFNSPNPDEPNTDTKVVVPEGTIAPLGSSRTRARSGPRYTNPIGAVSSRRARSPGSCSSGWSPGRARRWRQADGDRLCCSG